ncbi:MAG: hypothetical protein EPO41_24310 [Reyranella sp.]|uniref:hypothetical protein n=1 Tax=Reyranella sp. TaxID=1929291 RepID=UPI00120E5FAF|nr:hypothetical protein [Reyranella sp.]TAJ86916.1 MAG: hypothetical protein EPO41_24310 [Reyranella sp.]
MSGRIALGAAVLALIGWAAEAAPIPGSVQVLGSWIVQADNDASGKFAYCDATRDGGGALVHIGQSASGSWQIGFTNAGWQFTVGQDVPVTLFIDRVPYPLVLRTSSATTFSTSLPDTTLVDTLRQGNMLSLQLGAVYTTFPLDGSAAAINAAASCQQGYAASAAPPSPSPAAPAATPPPGGMPPEVAQEVSSLQGNCQVMNKTPPPIGDYVTRIGLTGSGIDDWLINTGGIACAGLTGGGGGGSMVEIFIGLPNGHARKVFARYALGVEIRGSTVWLGSSGDQCRGSAAAPSAPTRTCQVPLIWNKGTQRFDEGSPTAAR